MKDALKQKETILCQDFGAGVRTLRADRSITCGEEPQCLGTAGVFIPLLTIGYPLALITWMHKGFSESGRAKLRAACADDAAYEAEVARYKARFGFFAGKYEGWYCASLHAAPTHDMPQRAALPPPLDPGPAILSPRPPTTGWYEVLEMFRKLLLTSLGSALASGDKLYSQLLIKIAIQHVESASFRAAELAAPALLPLATVGSRPCPLLSRGATEPLGCLLGAF